MEVELFIGTMVFGMYVTYSEMDYLLQRLNM